MAFQRKRGNLGKRLRSVNRNSLLLMRGMRDT